MPRKGYQPSKRFLSIPGNETPLSKFDLPQEKVMVGDILTTLPRIPDNTVDLTILDPPYWKVVGEKWDYQWRTLSDYIDWCRIWIHQLGRICKLSSTLYLFGYVRNMHGLVQILESAGFCFRQEITLDKGIRSVAGRKTSTYKIFPNTTETIYMFFRDPKSEIRRFLKTRQLELGLSSKEINQKLGVKSNGGGMWSLYTGENIGGQIPTLEFWRKIEEILMVDVPEELKGQTFNPQPGLTNAWTDTDFYIKRRIHPTQEPLHLLERLIHASSNENGLVLDPFAGSGTTLLACKNLNRNCFCFDLDEEMVIKANNVISHFSHPPQAI